MLSFFSFFLLETLESVKHKRDLRNSTDLRHSRDLRHQMETTQPLDGDQIIKTFLEDWTNFTLDRKARFADFSRQTATSVERETTSRTFRRGGYTESSNRFFSQPFFHSGERGGERMMGRDY